VDDPWSLVAEPRRDAARDAVAAAFGRAPLEAIQPLTGGASATTFRIDVAGRPYVLRLEGERSAIRDPDRTFPCLEAAAAAGIAPAVRHLDRAQGVVIVDFHAPVPLGDYPGGAPALCAELGRMMARVQALPAFPRFADYAYLLRAMLGYVRDSTLFAPGLLDAHAEAFETLAAAYPWGAEPRVASHNDLNPRNLIFDGVRLWLIDWETAFRNDPFVDLAQITIETAVIPDLQDAMLTGWLGRSPDRRARDRLTLMTPLACLYYACLSLTQLVGRAPPGAPFPDLAAMTPDDFWAAVADGRLRRGSREISLAFSKMMLASFMSHAAAPETTAAMARLGAG
jgi:aminoglycoside phosphotransferase (APT) family kinase protein